MSLGTQNIIKMCGIGEVRIEVRVQSQLDKDSCDINNAHIPTHSVPYYNHHVCLHFKMSMILLQFQKA